MSNRRLRVIKTVAWGVLIALGLATGLAVHRLWKFRGEVEKLAERLSLDVGPQSTLLYDNNNNLISALFEEHRIAVRLDEMSPHLINAVLVTEDRRFFEHSGVDLRRIVAAFIVNQKAGAIVQGGSTITQQLVRSILLDNDRNYKRKVTEAILARRLEEKYAKREILEAYLNRVYFGDGYYGAEAASIGYFGKSVAKLEPAEAATLAGIIKGPSIYSPTKDPAASTKRRDIVLALMREDRKLSEAEYHAAGLAPVKALLARDEPTGVADPRHAHGADYFRDAISRELIQRFGAEAVYTSGLRVYTTLDRDLQRVAEEAIEGRLRAVDRKGGEPLQGALVAINPQTGFVKAIVGGRNFQESSYNRAIDARRQPGSAFKPFIYAVALESGFSPGSMLDGLDEPIPTHQGPWLPRGEHEVDSTTLRTALALSSNRAAAHLLQEVGLHRTLDMVQRFGINSPMPAVPALALGTGEVSLLELTSAYGVFADRGRWRAPTMIRRVVDRHGREIYTAPNTDRPVISEATAYMMSSMMSDVLRYGTAASARSAGFKLHAAGKTGTSQDYSDAWFVGFTPTIVTGVWFGFDKPRPIMKRGFASVVALPAWAHFMTAAMRGQRDEWLDMPASLVKVKICRISGMIATEVCHMPVFEAAPYDPNHPELMATGGIMRAGTVYEDVMPVDRVMPPCTMLHGAPANDPLQAPYYDPSLTAPVVPASCRDAVEVPQAVYAARSMPISPARPPVAPPAFMTDRPVRTEITTIAPAASLRALEPRAATEPLNPIIPGATVPKDAPAPAPTSEAVVPGAKIDKALPAPPAALRPPQQ